MPTKSTHYTFLLQTPSFKRGLCWLDGIADAMDVSMGSQRARHDWVTEQQCCPVLERQQVSLGKSEVQY